MKSTYFARSGARCNRHALTLIMSSLLLMGGALPTQAAQTPVPATLPVTEPATPAVNATTTDISAASLVTDPSGLGYSLTLKQLGRRDPMNLRGVESSDGVAFDIRADQVVTGATLTLQYSYSPALLPDLSQINILVNDEVAASLPLPKENAGKPQTSVVQIPARLITEFNRLSIQFIGHYTMQCEDPLHSSLWAKIGNDSQLNIQVSPITLKDDLSILPLPFFDRRDARPMVLPFVFATGTDHTTLEAAGALSSWFGGMSSYRGATFPTSLDQVPAQGNGVIMASATDVVKLGKLEIPAPKGPTVTIVTNPNDPHGKLLIISGRSSDELKTAADSLAIGSQTFAGQSVLIDHLDALKPRKPYDAPNWLASDRPVKIGELIDTKLLNVSGYTAGTINVPVRLPPDLFNWRENGVPLDLKYRYTPQPVSTNSSLLVSFNDAFMKSIALPSVQTLGASDSLLAALKKDDSIARDSTVQIPVNSVALQSRLQFRFMYDYIKQGDCRDIIIDNMRGLIDPDSTLDLSGYDHYMAMPNLGVFSDSGFPFTRLADLSETAVIMPEHATPADISAYLTVLGRFGESTGYPATGVTVAQAQQAPALANKDLLVFSSGSNQPLLSQWASHLSATVDGHTQHFQMSDLPLRMRQWLSTDPQANERQSFSAVTFSGDNSDTYLTSFESPLMEGRSVVIVAAGKPEALSEATAALIGGDDYKQTIQGSLAVIQGKSIKSLVANEDYYVGHLSPFRWVQWTLSQNLWLMLLVTLVGLLLVSGLIYLSLRARARKRLE